MSNSTIPRGPGLFEVGRVNGEHFLTNVRRIAGVERAPARRWCRRPRSCSACWPPGCSW